MCTDVYLEEEFHQVSHQMNFYAEDCFIYS